MLEGDETGQELLEEALRVLELDADHIRYEHTQGLLEQLLPRFVPLEHDDRPSLHGGGL